MLFWFFFQILTNIAHFWTFYMDRKLRKARFDYSTVQKGNYFPDSVSIYQNQMYYFDQIKQLHSFVAWICPL